MPRRLHGLPILGYEALTGSGSAQGLTKAKYDKVPPAVGAIVTIDTAPIRWTADGTTPTSSEGNFAIPTQDPIILIGSQMTQFLFINFGVTNAKLRVNYVGSG